MRSKPRCFSAHRRGCVTRSTILSILHSHGKEIATDGLNAMVRWGGWQGITGVLTIVRTYAQKVIEKYLDCFGMAYGRVGAAEEWDARLADYIGQALSPADVIFDSVTSALPMQLKMYARQWPGYAHLKHDLNRAVAAIMLVAVRDPEVMPVHRYREYRAAFNLVLKKHGTSKLVIEYRRLRAEWKPTWQAALTRATSACVAQYALHQPEAVLDKHALERAALAGDAIWQPGNVTPDGKRALSRCIPGVFTFSL